MGVQLARDSRSAEFRLASSCDISIEKPNKSAGVWANLACDKLSPPPKTTHPPTLPFGIPLPKGIR